MVLDPVPVARPGTKPWEQRSAVVGGKFICPPQLAKWLGKMRFLAGSRDNRVDELFYRREIHPRLNPPTA